MREVSTIRSASNPRWKRVGAVLAGKDRERVVLEGDRLIEDALRAGWSPDEVFVRADRPAQADAWREAGLPVTVVAETLFGRGSGLTTSPGSLALAPRPPRRRVADLALGPRALVLVAAGVADPGNLGALARAAEAAGATALVALDGGASPWSAKCLRGSMGSLLRLPVVEEGADEVAAALEAAGLRQLRADTRGGASFAEVDWSGPLALWVTSETGETPAAARGFEAVRIPMRGGAESLNVAVAAAVLLYAAGRWREEGP